jgi:predicted ATPase
MDSGVPSNGATAGLIGRRADVARLREFLEQASTTGGALLLSGDPGIGKTVLLGDVVAAARAAGSRVLRTAGSEFLTDLSFSTLASLLQPLKSELSELDDLHREAVTAMLGLEPGRSPTSCWRTTPCSPCSVAPPPSVRC